MKILSVLFSSKVDVGFLKGFRKLIRKMGFVGYYYSFSVERVNPLMMRGCGCGCGCENR